MSTRPQISNSPNTNEECSNKISALPEIEVLFTRLMHNSQTPRFHANLQKPSWADERSASPNSGEKTILWIGRRVLRKPSQLLKLNGFFLFSVASAVNYVI